MAVHAKFARRVSHVAYNIELGFSYLLIVSAKLVLTAFHGLFRAKLVGANVLRAASAIAEFLQSASRTLLRKAQCTRRIW